MDVFDTDNSHPALHCNEWAGSAVPLFAAALSVFSDDLSVCLFHIRVVFVLTYAEHQRALM